MASSALALDPEEMLMLRLDDQTLAASSSEAVPTELVSEPDNAGTFVSGASFVLVPTVCTDVAITLN